MESLNHKLVWLHQELNSLRDKRESLVNRIAVIEVKIEKKKDAIAKVQEKINKK